MPNKAVFLDRDDTIVDDPGYIQSPEQLRLIPGVTDALKQLKLMGYLLVIVTNQSGIARGFLTEEDLETIHHELKRQLAAEGVIVDGLYYCPYHPDGEVKDFSIESNLRKPNAGMLFLAEEELEIDLKKSWMIGDSYRDVQAGKEAGCRTILVDVPGKIREKKPADPEPDRKAVNMREAVNIIRMHQFHQKAKFVKKTTKQKPNIEKTTEPVSHKETTFDKADIKPPLSVPDTKTNTVSEKVEPDNLAKPDTEKPTGTPSETIPRENPKVKKLHTAKSEPRETPPQNTDTETTHRLLEDIALRLKRNNREGLYEEFSVFKLLAFMVQAIALLGLVFSICLWLSPKDHHVQVQTMIGFTVALQLIVIALLMMHSRN